MDHDSHTDSLEFSPKKIGLLLNPMSGQVKKREQAVRNALEQIPGGILCEATEASGFIAATNTLIQADIDLLVIIAGDGTSHAVLSHLFMIRPIDEWPVLIIVPGGTTNMTPLDLGMRGKPDAVLLRLIEYLHSFNCYQSAKLVQRPVLRIEQYGKQPIYGMFFAVGLVARGVKFSRSSIKQIGITGGIFTFIIMLRSLIGKIFGRNNRDWSSVHMLITKENGETQEGTFLFALVSALNCLLLKIRPYWGEETAPLHVTWVDQQHKRLWRAIWPLLTGNGRRLKAQDGYHSHNSHSLTIHLDDEYIVDGELYRSNSNQPLRIDATQPVTFLVL